jgi:AbiV family abortive infection protein
MFGCTMEAQNSWIQSVNEALAVGQSLCSNTDEFNAACDHIVQLLTDASMLLAARSHATAAFLAITAMEETAKVHIGMFRRSGAGVKRSKDPLFNHSHKHKLSTGPTVLMGSRLPAAIGEARLKVLIEMAHSGQFVHLREKALYIAQPGAELQVPLKVISREKAIGLLLLAVESFDDSLVGFTNYSMEASLKTDAIFEQWAAAT